MNPRRASLGDTGLAQGSLVATHPLVGQGAAMLLVYRDQGRTDAANKKMPRGLVRALILVRLDETHGDTAGIPSHEHYGRSLGHELDQDSVRHQKVNQGAVDAAAVQET